MHSVNVYNVLRSRYFDEDGGDSEETFAICALLHDICKAQYYKTSLRNVKNEITGAWEKGYLYDFNMTGGILWLRLTKENALRR